MSAPQAVNRLEGGRLLTLTASGQWEQIGTIPSGDAARAVDLLNRADREQARRRYTAAARLYAQAEQCAQIVWVVA